ncbi:MAG TPA: hypothetical protein PK467_17600 [Candidatus Wallbacteria bacterium]|nr:hypothetical protein [Candidatus Wallbacteria bacterium]
MTFPPPDFNYITDNCPKCKLGIDENEVSVQCPKCFTVHHQRCIHEGVACGNLECDYIFMRSEEDGTLVFAEYEGEERRNKDRRQKDIGPPEGMPERRIAPRRRADF